MSTSYPLRLRVPEFPEHHSAMKSKVKVPERLLEEINELAEGLEYTNRSEFLREVLRDTLLDVTAPVRGVCRTSSHRTTLGPR